MAADFSSIHFDLHTLTDGVYAAVHKAGGAAYSNAGIIDLGDQTVVFDCFDNPLAAEDLKKAAEKMTGCQVQTVIISHEHDDHWNGNQVFQPPTEIIAHRQVMDVMPELIKEMDQLKQNPAEYQQYLKDLESELDRTTDERLRAGLEKGINRALYAMQVLQQMEPRSPDKSFEDRVVMVGSKRTAVLEYRGACHSSSDSILLLPGEKLAFIADLGFFNEQPFMGTCNLPAWREQIENLKQLEGYTFVPGHGGIGAEKELDQMLAYFDTLERLVKQVLEKGASQVKPEDIQLPQPIDSWLMGGMKRLEVNLNYMVDYVKGNM